MKKPEPSIKSVKQSSPSGKGGKSKAQVILVVKTHLIIARGHLNMRWQLWIANQELPRGGKRTLMQQVLEGSTHELHFT
jgi:hypothetical protein